MLHPATALSAETLPPFNTRMESMKPLGPQSELALAKLADDGIPGKRDQLMKQMQWAIEVMKKAADITEAEKTALLEDAKKPIEAALTAWKPRYIESLRFYLVREEADAAQARRVQQWRMDQAEKRLTIAGWTLPDLLPMWQEAVKARLGPERGELALAAREAKRVALEKELHTFLETWGTNNRGSMDEELRACVEDMKKELQLDAKQTDALFEAARQLVDAHVAAEIIAGADLMRSLPEEQRLVTMGRNNSFGTRFVRPTGIDLENKWKQIAAALIGADRVTKWAAALEKQKAKDEEQIIDSLKPSEQQTRTQMEELMDREVDGLATALDMDTARRTQLQALAKKAVDASIDAAWKNWRRNMSKWSAIQRRIRRQNTYLGVVTDDQPQKQPVWLEGLKNIVTAEEQQRVKDEATNRKARMGVALARITLIEMDRYMALDATQRSSLEKLILPHMQDILREESEQYWSYSTTQLFQAAAKVDTKTLTTLLDEWQRTRWEKLRANPPDANNNSSNSGQVPTISDEDPAASPEAEPLDVEVETSRHLYKYSNAERQRRLDLMLARVEDARRTLTLPAEKTARLRTAAKGAVEADMREWRVSVESWVRSAVQRATPENVRQTLASMERSSFGGRQTGGPEKQEIWQRTLSSLLSESERTHWTRVQTEREAARLTALASMTTQELDRRRRLSATQHEKVTQLVTAVLKDYLPDIERYMSHSWYLQYYYSLLPLAGVKDADLKAILTERQWKAVEDRDLPDAEQYWEGIENYHKQRLERGDSDPDDPFAR
ncbi:MAG: hypothetical protein IPK32_14740 [Verrucomicrobiaceae bacterium]|nr:hypothetical protein [Verrucomicrobiaceae bacterium]